MMAVADRTLIGFDYGSHRIGVAVGQELTGSTTALTVLKAIRNRPDWSAILCLIDRWRPHALVVGIPYDLDGGEQAMTHSARRFARQLGGRCRLPVYTADEHLSSIAATEMGFARGRSSGRERMLIDDLAAEVILQTFMGHRQDEQDIGGG